MRFRDIPQFTRSAGYSVDVSWDYLPSHYLNYVQDYGLDVSPDFQRDYVWTAEQKVRYVEYILQGGMSGKDIYFNAPGWRHGETGHFVLVDGKQRLDAVLAFLNNEFPIFGGAYRRDFEDNPGMLIASFKFHVNDLKTRAEVLQWYIDLNAGGTIHTPDEINRVRALKEANAPHTHPDSATLLAQARLDRQVLVEVAEEERLQKAEQDARNAERETAEKAKKGKRGKKV